MDTHAPSLPPYALYPATFVALLALLYAMSQTRYRTGKFLIAIVWLRYVMQAFHEVTFAPVFSGVSGNALASIVVVALGIPIVTPRIPLLNRLPIMLCFMAAVTFSGIANNAYAGLIDTLLKWGYFFIVMLCAYDCMRRKGGEDVLRPLIWAFAPPLIYQFLSILLGVSKATESDGSISFIGGFNHEAAFSIVLITCFTIVSLARNINSVLRMALLFSCIAGIILANYRTAMISLAPIAAGYFIYSVTRGLRASERLFVGTLAMATALGAISIAGWLMSDRLVDLATAAHAGSGLFKPPADFSAAERELFSGRIYLWNRYLDGYLSGSFWQLVFGFGPNSWEETFGLYAHNTLVSYLYEFGVLGESLIVAIWISMLSRASSISDPSLRGQMIFAHIGFILLNFATMPFWQIEGLIFYGILCGYTLHLTVPVQRHRQANRTLPARALAIPSKHTR